MMTKDESKHTTVADSEIMPRVLIVDDEMAILETLRILLKGEGFSITTAAGGKAGLARLDEFEPDVVLTDIRMPDITGVQVLASVREKYPECPVILMTAQATLQSAMQAVNEGAFYYIQKPFRNDELLAILKRAVEHKKLREENHVLKQEIKRRDRKSSIAAIGKSRAWQEALRLAEMVAPTDSTLLITGESGTGKEVIARYVHELSGRSDLPFMSINCGALPETLLESELFGHVKGSFTGAVKDKVGLFAAAQGGTFFLDEIGETTPAIQVKLLRVLQQREVIPVGATEPVAVNARVLAATNRDLEEEIKRGSFRSDLYYRLNVIALHLPPLRARIDDIALLSEHFMSHMARERDTIVRKLSDDALDALMAYSWPGNVRELENAIERAVILSSGNETIERSALPSRIVDRSVEPFIADRAPANPTLEAVERAYVWWVLSNESGNKARAAEVLGIDPSTLYRKLARYGEGRS